MNSPDRRKKICFFCVSAEGKICEEHIVLLYCIMKGIESKKLMSPLSKIRQPGAAGGYYPADKMMLERELSLLLEASEVMDFPRPVRALIVPHANYAYSGGVAARAFRQILDAPFERVIIIAPSHTESFPFITVFNGDAYRTPLGEVPVDSRMAHVLTSLHPGIRLSEMGHSSPEFTIEVQLPFLQWVLSRFKILPIVIGEQSEENMTILYEVLRHVLTGQNNLVIASTDLSRHQPDSQARVMDQVVINHIRNFSADDLWKDIQENRAQMCAPAATVVAMKIARVWGAREGKVLLYRNSGDVSGKREDVTGYLSAVFY